MSSSQVVLAAASVALVLAAVALMVAAASRHKKGATGEIVVLGALAAVETALEPEGSVLIGGELWMARSSTGERVARGATVRVVGVDGHLLKVEPAR